MHGMILEEKHYNMEYGGKLEYLELDEDGSYGLAADGKWHITPLGLAAWMDEEGGLSGLMERNGQETFIEAGCDPEITNAYVDATWAMKRELARIGAVLL